MKPAAERYVEKADPQLDLFETDELHTVWREWQDMPEFVQPEQTCYAMITVCVASQEALEAFSKLIGQSVRDQGARIWYPKLDMGKFQVKWVDGA